MSLQQAKYKKVLRAIEKELEEGAPRADTGEIQKRDQQKSIKPHSQRYRENYSIGTQIRINCRNFEFNRSRINSPFTESATSSFRASITRTFQRTVIYSTSHRRRHQLKRSELKKRPEIAEFKRFIYYRS
jgi:hypothetical protein